MGIDTVALGGAGFELLVKPGERVANGTPLLRFDLDAVARKAKSLVTPVVLSASGTVARCVTNRLVAQGDLLFEVEAQSSTSAHADAGPASTAPMRVPFDHGLHVRPAALVAAALKPHQAEVRIVFHGRGADARSAVGLMALGVRCGDTVEVQARGRDAAAAIDALSRVLAPVVEEKPAPVAARIAKPGRVEGVIASRGVSVGVAARWVHEDEPVEERASSPADETRALEAALRGLEEHLSSMAQSAKGARRELLQAHGELVRDPALAQRAAALIGGGKQSIVIADDLMPSQLIALDASRLAGICLARGGATSHVAILAASGGIPALVAAGASVLDVADGTAVILDAEHGWIDIDPPAAEIGAAAKAAAQRAAERAADLAHAREPAVTLDGVRIVVNANAGSIADARSAMDNGAEGCGLLRTEFLFLDRRDAPDEDEQAAEYERIAQAFEGRPVNVRTLDIGGDKPIAYLPLPREENPALGLRGVRTSLAHPHLLEAQLRAIARASQRFPCRVLVPMVNDAEELAAVRALAPASLPPIGVMIETPAAALAAHSLASHADFLSIGSNDLAQYVLAIDRGHADLARRLDALHPAVLKLIAATVEGARAHGRSVSVCGAMASDVDALPILIGLGVHEISATPSAIPRLKRLVRGLDARECTQLAQRALAAEGASEVRDLAQQARARARAASQSVPGVPR